MSYPFWISSHCPFSLRGIWNVQNFRSKKKENWSISNQQSLSTKTIGSPLKSTFMITTNDKMMILLSDRSISGQSQRALCEDGSTWWSVWWDTLDRDDLGTAEVIGNHFTARCTLGFISQENYWGDYLQLGEVESGDDALNGLRLMW